MKKIIIGVFILILLAGCYTPDNVDEINMRKRCVDSCLKGGFKYYSSNLYYRNGAITGADCYCKLKIEKGE